MSGDDIYCDIPINRAPWCDCWRIHTDHEGPPKIVSEGVSI